MPEAAAREPDRRDDRAGVAIDRAESKVEPVELLGWL